MAMPSLASTFDRTRMASFVFLLLIQAMISTTAAGQSYSNITRGTTLTALGSPSSWLSPSSIFAFGFFPIDSNASLFLLAIWFDSTNPKTVVWTANRSVLLPAGSTVQLTSNGQLILKNTNGNEAWRAHASNASAAALLDSGNLVLVGASHTDVVWQSFDFPTDTLLPGQVLPEGAVLRSQLTDADFSAGRFQLAAQTDGDLALSLLALPTGDVYTSYWSLQTSGSGNQLVYNITGSVYFALSNGTIINITAASNYTAQNYQRARLDPDGVFRQYVYPSTAGGSQRKTWNVVANIPADICSSLATVTLGSGACGYNSYCSPGSDQTEINCMCPPQYSFIDEQNKYKGCKQDFLQSCELYDASGFDFIPVDSLDWPYDDYEHYMNISESLCVELCLEDCYSGVAIFWSGRMECWKKKLPLSHGSMWMDRRALIKVPKGNASLALPPGPATITSVRSNLNQVAVVLLGCSGSLNLALIGLIFAMIFASYRKKAVMLQRQDSISELNLRVFSYKELEQTTKGFEEELGRGAFGVVYKGVLVLSGRMSIAVKRLDRLLQIDSEKEFKNEVRSIGQTHHKNLVRLIGYCNEGSHRLLVYEYMSKGPLMEFLFGDVKMRWEQRIEVILGIARGLLYLHEECSTPIIHCDIKPQNVLLDANCFARISDFGLAKLLKMDQTRSHTGIRGTRGYVAPEWFKSMAITKKVDVYSFGVMLMEIICCRKNLEMEVGEEEVTVLVYWAYDCFRERRLDVLLNNDEEAMADLERAGRFVTVAIWCIQEDPSLRPSVRTVTQMLEGAIPVPMPPDPSSSSGLHSTK